MIKDEHLDRSVEAKYIILPCAGGCASNYNKYKRFLPSVTIYEYPGHWTRYNEGLVNSIPELVEDLVKGIISDEQNMPLYLFGHSMGGIIAWRAAKKLLSMGLAVAGLYIAACNSPLESIDFLRGIESDSDIKRFLSKIRQVPSNVLESEFFRENLLPPIRNDFRIIQNASDENDLPQRKINIPIICFYGKSDPLVQYDNIKKWGELTERDAKFVPCSGDHFFVYDNRNVEYISSIITKNQMLSDFGL